MASFIRTTHFQDFGERSVLRGAVLIYLAAAAIYTVLRYLMEVRLGGHVWTTGDWLISYRAGFIRRGLTGSITYGLTDLTGIPALYVAAATQILIFAALIATVFFMLRHIKMTVPVAILAMSPVFLLMPFFILKLAMTKEMIGFLAVALVGLTAFTRHRWPLWVGVVVFAASGFAHEINAFLAPDLLTLLLGLTIAGVIPRRQAALAAGVVGVSAGAAILSSMLFSGQGMGDAVCKVMLSYGGITDFCEHNGPTVWLDRDMAYGVHFTWVENVVKGVWPWFILGFVLSMAPFVLFQVTGDVSGRQTRFALLAAVIGILAYSPLFVIASDWGRWIQMHVFCLTIMTFVSLRLGLLRERFENLNPVFLAIGLVWAMPDYGEPLTAGFLQKLGSLVGHAERFFGGKSDEPDA
jgi:hypothetical protein